VDRDMFLHKRGARRPEVQDRDHTSESRALLDSLNRIHVELLSYIRGSLANDDYVLFVHSGSHRAPSMCSLPSLAASSGVFPSCRATM
jgi:hypothetical protein